MRIAVCGGVYSNPYSLSAFIIDATARGAQRLYCLGDLGGYGAEPEAVWPLLNDNSVECIAGNYDVAIAGASPDCGCGYQDPRDREYAQLMYDFTLSHTSRGFAAWMAGLDTERRESIDGCAVHFVHGSPITLNDFWWESLDQPAHATRVAESGAEVIFCTHSGLPWIRRIGETLAVNVGVIGRPPNDGTLDVRYALADLSGAGASVDIINLPYDWQAQARSMREAQLPEAFVHTNETGWWATCLEILPTEERSRGRYHVYSSSVPALLDAAGLPASAWPEIDPSLPVRPLPGSPLFPGRVWIIDSTLLTPDLIADTESVGVTDLRVAGTASAPTERPIAGRAGTLVPELTLSRAGWHWHPAMLTEPPFLAAVSSTSGVPALPSAAIAHQTAVQLLLDEFQQDGALSVPRYCVA